MTRHPAQPRQRTADTPDAPAPTGLEAPDAPGRTGSEAPGAPGRTGSEAPGAPGRTGLEAPGALGPTGPEAPGGEHGTPLDAPAATAPDSGLLSPVRAGVPVEDVVGDRAWLQAMLDAEAALARTQAALGAVPATAADAIGRAARAELYDPRELALASRATANPVVGLVRALTEAVARRDPRAAEYVHRGSTSQDVLDTGAMLVASRALTVVRSDLARAADALADLAERHRATVAAARTLALHAVPTTFGLRAAGWRSLVLDAEHRLAVVQRSLPVSLGGAAGTLAGYLEYARQGAGTLDDDYADRLVDAYAAELGLARPVLPWHALRTPVADLGAALAFTAGALGKFAADVTTLSRTEVGEVTEPTGTGRGASSAMPHKRNPALATLIRSAALQVPAFASVLTRSLVAEDERAAGAWHAEWLPLRECLRLTGGAAATAYELAAGLVVRPERVRANLALTRSQIVTERLAAALAPHLGRARAARLLADASARADREDRPLAAVLAEDADVARHLDAAALDALLDPAHYTGAADRLVTGALRQPAAAPHTRRALPTPVPR
ncbi:lyase family protein [Streptomyces sp. G45]|uniref:lyase family protein n=1 Tax=Streptomyces sp. G45 TaxID=3406627 RepID=UPI003C14449E